MKYGDDYRECMRRVPMWNIARGIIKKRGWDIEWITSSRKQVSVASMMGRILNILGLLILVE